MLESLAVRFSSGDERALGASDIVFGVGPRRFGDPRDSRAQRPGPDRRADRTAGVGKSTLCSALVRKARAEGLRVGVISVDPSSPFSHGAILGDRIRLTEHFTDPGVFIRSMASRGHSGGLAGATGDAVTLLDAFGYEFIIVETVGVGQSEIEIAELADSTVVVLQPGSGDSVQLLKAGILEVADVFVVNKADHPAALQLQREIRSMMEMLSYRGWIPNWSRPKPTKAPASTSSGTPWLSTGHTCWRRANWPGAGAMRSPTGSVCWRWVRSRAVSRTRSTRCSTRPSTQTKIRIGQRNCSALASCARRRRRAMLRSEAGATTGCEPPSKGCSRQEHAPSGHGTYGMSNRPRLGFAGVGRMGASMALHLHDLGYEVAAVYDTDERLAREVAAGVKARPPRTLAEVTALSEAVITVVSDDAAMDRIFALEGDSLLRGAQGRIFINCATLTPAVHLETERRCEAAGAEAFEACMAGSIPQAREGTLYLIAAGKPETFERVRPILRDLSAELRYAGAAGEAAKVKALVNMVMNSNTAALAEGLGLGEALGLDLTMLREVFAGTGAASRVLQTDGEDMQLRQHDVYFSAAHAAKDSHIAVALAREHGVAVPIAEATAAQYDRLIELGLGNLDKSAVAELTFRSRSPR